MILRMLFVQLLRDRDKLSPVSCASVREKPSKFLMYRPFSVGPANDCIYHDDNPLSVVFPHLFLSVAHILLDCKQISKLSFSLVFSQLLRYYSAMVNKKLTDRQRAILRRLILGERPRDIAKALDTPYPYIYQVMHLPKAQEYLKAMNEAIDKKTIELAASFPILDDLLNATNKEAKKRAKK